jgi:type IV pilus assembly protein PilC
MVTYNYTARDPATGKKVRGSIVSDSPQQATKDISGQGLAVLNVKVESSGGLLSPLRGRIKTKDKVIFSRQLSTLINAGLPLVQSLRSVIGQTKNKKFLAVLNEVIVDVEGGKAFSAALSKHPNVFNRIFTSLVAAGEASGTLDAALERLANQQEKDAEIMSKVRGAMIYPIIVVLVMAGVVGFMLVSVLPQVELLYQGMSGAKLPPLTVALLVVSNFIINQWLFVLITAAVAVVFTTKWARTLGGRRAIDGLKLRMWPVKPLFSKMYMARFSRTSTTLIASGVPLIQALEITAEAVDNIHIKESIMRAANKVKDGKALSASLEGDVNFLDLVPKMLKIGEDSGAIEQMMAKTADFYEREVDDQIKAISTIIEPLLMVVLGVVAIIIVAAILLPIYGLVGKNAF